MNSNAAFGRSMGLPNMMPLLYQSYENDKKYGLPIGSYPLSNSYHYNMPGTIPKQMSYSNWIYPSMKRKMHHCTGGKKMIRCGYNMHPQFPIHQQPQQQSNFMDIYQSYLPYGLRQTLNSIPGSMPMEPWIFNNNNNMPNDFMQMLQTQNNNNNMQQSVQTDDQQNQQELELQQLDLQQWVQPQLTQQQLKQHDLQQLPLPKPQEPQQTYQNITTQTGYRDAGGAGCNTVTGASAFRIDPGSDCNYYENFISHASSRDQSLNRINSVTSFDNGYGGRMRDSQLDLFEYNRRHKSMHMSNGLILPSTTDTMETILMKESRSKRELKSEIKELKRLLKKHPQKQPQPRSISATLMCMAKKESNTKIKLKEEIHDLKEKLKSIQLSKSPVISPPLQPVKLSETKSKRLLRDEICDLKRRVKDQIIKQTLKWRRRFYSINLNHKPTTSKIPPRNSDRAVFDFRKIKAQIGQDKKKLKVQRNLAAPLQNYPSEQSNSVDGTSNYDSIQHWYGNWLTCGHHKDCSKKQNSQQEASNKPYSVPPVKSIRQHLMQEENKKISKIGKSIKHYK